MKKVLFAALIALATMGSQAMASDSAVELAPVGELSAQELSELQLPEEFSTQSEVDAEQRRWICYAESRFGETFGGISFNRQAAARGVMRYCARRTGWRCEFLGCRRYGGGGYPGWP